MWDVKVVGQGVESLLRLDAPSSGSLVEAFINTKKVRHGPRPSPANIKSVGDLIGPCVRDSRPIEVLTMWGAAKGYAQHAVRTADLLDLMALKRFAALQADVVRLHAPGVHVRILWEDYTEAALTGYRSDEYHDSLVELIRATGLGFVEVVKESSLIAGPEFADDCRNNAAAILAGEEAKVGWRGEIAWDHYIERAASEYPDLPDQDRRAKVAQYLGITLARYQHRMMPGGCVKLSFVPYPATVPDSMRAGRVEWKVKTGKNCNHSMAPWCGFGVLEDDGWSVASVRDLRSRKFRVGTFVLNGLEVPVLRDA